MTWNLGLTKMQDILSNLYPTASRSSEIVEKAQLPTGRINFERASLGRWHDILEEADRHEKIHSIVAIAQEEYKAKKEELTEAEQQYLSLLEKGDGGDQLPPDLRQHFSGFKQKNNLVDALLACPAISNRHTRDTVVDNLSSDIKNIVQRSSADRVDVMNIVTTVLNYENGLGELVAVVRAFEGNSVPMQNLDRLLA